MSVILGRLSGAFLLNCELFALTLLFALPLGLVVAFGSMSRCKVLSGAVKTFVWVIRGTPLMLQIIVIYLGPGLLGMSNCWVSVKQFSKNDTATACQDWLRSTRLGRGSIKSHVRTVKVLGMGLFAFQERIHLWKGVTH